MLGKLSEHTLFRLLVFMALVYLTVYLGTVLPKLWPQMPLVMQKILDPQTGNANTQEAAHL